MRWPVLALACACSSKKPPPPTELEAIETALGHRLLGVVLAPSGTTYVDGHAVDDVHFPEALAKSTSKTDPINVWLLADRVPAVNTIAMLQIVAEQQPVARLMTTNVAGKAEIELCGRAELSREPFGDPESVRLIVVIDTARIWIGLSRVLEFQEIPNNQDGHDYPKLQQSLADHKQSAFFEGKRNDLEMSAQPEVKGEAYTFAFAAACNAGYTKLSILRADQISAQPR